MQNEIVSVILVGLMISPLIVWMIVEPSDDYDSERHG